MKRFRTTNIQEIIGKSCNDNMLVNTYYLLNKLKPYEVQLDKLCKQYKIKIPIELQNSNKDYTALNINAELKDLLVENKCWIDILSDNTWNYSGKINHDIDFTIFRDRKTNMYYVDVSIHIEGDIRGNYTDSVFYEFEAEDEFLNFLYDEENIRKNTIMYKGIYYNIYSCCMQENLKICDGNNKETNVLYYYDTDRAKIEKKLEEYIVNRNEKLEIGKIIEIFDMKDKNTMKNVDFDRTFYNMKYYKIEKISRYDFIVASVDNPTIKVRIRKLDVFDFVKEG